VDARCDSHESYLEKVEDTKGVNRRKTDNTMANRKRKRGETENELSCLSPKCMVTEMPHTYFPKQIEIRVRVVVFNATFDNISVLSW
jgi:hypothetical protein